MTGTVWELFENPSPDPKQPFSRQNYVGTIGGPIKKDKIWFFSSIEYVHEDASIAYSPSSQAQFTALASLAAQGLIPGVPSIAVPANVPVPFRDYLATARLDWSIVALAVVRPRGHRQLRHAQRPGTTRGSALYGP
jgi:hypothetical protein